jgi:hypothetical protein
MWATNLGRGLVVALIPVTSLVGGFGTRLAGYWRYKRGNA